MPIDTNSIQSILAAFQAGVQEKQQREAFEYRKQKDTEEAALKQQQMTEATRQFNEQLKQRSDAFKLQQETHNLLQKTREFDLKRKLAEDIASGRVPHQVQSPLMNLPGPISGVQVPGLPTEKAPVSRDEVTLQPNEYQTSTEFYESSPEFRQKRYLEGLENARILAQKIADQQFRREQQEDQQAFLRSEHELNRAAIQSRFDAGAAARTKREEKIDRTIARQDRKDIEALIKEHDNNPTVRNLPKLATDEKQLQRIAKSPGKVTGADDVALAYIFARVMDPNSTVREGEVNTISNMSATMAEKLGVDIRRIASSADRFTPQQRIRIIQTLMPRLANIKQDYNRYRSEVSERIKDVDPDYEIEKKLHNPFAGTPEDKTTEIPTASGADLEAIRKAKGGK